MPTSTPDSRIAILRTIHRIHRQLTDLRERRDRGPKQIRAADANVQRTEEELAKAKAEYKAMRVAADQKQLQLKTGEDKVKDLRRKLNAANNNREYQALLEQIAGDEMTNSVLADEILEALEKVDGFQHHIAEAEAALAGAKQRVGEVRAEVAKHEPAIAADIARLEAELRENEATLPRDIDEMYQRVVKQKGEDALASIDNQCCDGCNQQIPLNIVNQVMLGRPVFCKSCGRLLYMPE